MGEMLEAIKEIGKKGAIKKYKQDKKEIDGWLFLFVLGLFLISLVYLYYIVTYSIFYIIFFIFQLYVIYLMYKRKKLFKEMAVISLWVFPLYLLSITPWIEYFNAVGYSSLFFLVIWTYYLFVSKRVKNTFIEK
ncbi:MAG: DUF2569 family protein [Nanoarchaeota archaeon]|nr:DUF2569 family protein [Nanoarchaeota archaeon]MBU0962982.1 DUF2569 family protein [Nanoarchaeota archaeon]